MLIVELLTYTISLFMIASSIMVTISDNSVYSILYLILCFLCAAGIMILVKCEIIAFLFLMLYVGAVSILLLFVIMMISSNNNKLTINNKLFSKFNIYGGFLCIFFFIELFFIILTLFDFNPYKNSFLSNHYTNWFNFIDKTTDLTTLGQVLYTYYTIDFFLLGMILLMGIIGSVVLTINTKFKHSKQQHAFKQLSRNYKNIFLKKTVKHF